MSTQQILLFAVVLFLSYYIASIAGFGGGLLSTSFLVFFVDLRVVTPILALTGFLLNLDIIRTSYKNIKWRIALTISAFSFVGVYFGTQLLFGADLFILEKVLAGFIVLAGLNIYFDQPIKLETANIIYRTHLKTNPRNKTLNSFPLTSKTGASMNLIQATFGA